MATPSKESISVADWWSVASKLTEGGSVTAITTPRSTGKSMMARMWKEMMETPGYSSEEAAKYGSHDAYMKSLKSKKKAEGKEMSEVNEKLDLLQRLAKEGEFKFTLGGPHSLTIKKSAGYRKSAFIGGEVFQLKDAYRGTRDGIILVFSERGDLGLVTSDPDTLIEIPLKEASKVLDEFAAWWKVVQEPSPEVVKQAAQKVAKKRLEEDEVFGSW